MKRILLILALGIFGMTANAFAGSNQPIPAPGNVSAVPDSAKTLSSGLAYEVIVRGTGDVHPKLSDTVTVHYTGWTTDGRMFDSSVVRGEPATFPLNMLIKGWQEGIPLMVTGETARFWIPADLAYGENPRAGAPSGMLVFDIKLIAIQPGS
ncbi:MAG TPA: FKBP-type peptidyl-prolyl cis-trans isomerase [Gammaproteobacteria bacterium]|nr:FKBP-type peptidyl-prolyl cis-trans isomerase [Gammaproteobacteria bacterium]